MTDTADNNFDRLAAIRAASGKTHRPVVTATSERPPIDRTAPVVHPTIFDGETYDPDADYARLKTLTERVFGLMRDGKPRTLAIIARLTGGTEASVSARLRDLRKAKFGCHTVQRTRIGDGLFEYRVVVREALAV